MVVVWRKESFCLRVECGISQTNTGETYSAFPDFTPATKTVAHDHAHSEHSSADRAGVRGAARHRPFACIFILVHGPATVNGRVLRGWAAFEGQLGPGG